MYLMSNRRYTYEDVKTHIESKNFKLIDENYDNSNQRITIKDSDRYYYITTYNRFKNNKLPHFVHKNNPYSIQNIKLWCKLNNKLYELISEKYENNSKLLKWLCLKEGCKEEFEMSWGNISQGQNCSYCHGLKTGKSNCLATKNPQLASEWHPTKNGKLAPFDVTSSASKKVWWLCSKNPTHEWEAYINNRNCQNNGCPYCSGRYATKEYNLLIANPELCKEWDYNKNKKNPEEYLPNSSKKVFWICFNNSNHKWEAVISDRNNGHNCPYCSGKLPSEDYNLLIINPDLCKEWNYDKNIKNPEEYTPNSGQKVWWICENGHEWESIIGNRSGNNNRGCPYCSNQLPTNQNNLLTNNPELCEEWNYNKNKKKPEEFTKSSGQKVWWICKECKHEWQAVIYNRNRLKRGCPQCNESHGEKKIKEWLEYDNIYFKKQYEFTNLLSDLGNPLRFDFAVLNKYNKLICLIEYDGEGHFSEKPFSKKSYETTVKHDQLKNDYCKNNNILLLRIPYWEFDNIENILINWFYNIYIKIS